MSPSFQPFRLLIVLSLMGSMSSPMTAEAFFWGKSSRREAQPDPNVPPAFIQVPTYELPYSDWAYARKPDPKRGFFRSEPDPSPEMLQLISVIRTRAEHIAGFGLPYVFGGDHPKEGGLDCSGAIKFLLSDIGFTDLPRTSYGQYDWMRKSRSFKHTKTIPEQMGGKKGIKPGDLIFWGGTYDSGHKVSHVMIYLGQGSDGTHYMFGARGKKKRGFFGHGVDIWELSTGYNKSLIGFGTLPGVS
jgi:hypothetical protein